MYRPANKYVKETFGDCINRSPSHMEGNCWPHTKMVVDYVSKNNPDADKVLMYSAIFHDVGKPKIRGQSPIHQFWGHPAASAKIWVKWAKANNVDAKTTRSVYKIIKLHMGATPEQLSKLTKKEWETLYKLSVADVNGRISQKEKSKNPRVPLPPHLQ